MDEIDKMSLSASSEVDELKPIEDHVRKLLEDGYNYYLSKAAEAERYIFFKMLEPEEYVKFWGRFNSSERAIMKKSSKMRDENAN